MSFNLAVVLKAVLRPPTRMRQAWGWKPGRDELIPDITIFDDRGESARLTGTPHVAVEILSTDRAADIIRKATKYAAAGLERYWIVDPEGPTMIVHRLADGVLVEQSRHGPGTTVTLDIGPTEVTFDPAKLLE